MRHRQANNVIALVALLTLQIVTFMIRAGWEATFPANLSRALIDPPHHSISELSLNRVWSWIWPSVGATPIHQGLDLEMFDRTDYPYSETFVREAIQNSLDARLDSTKPVLV